MQENNLIHLTVDDIREAIHHAVNSVLNESEESEITNTRGETIGLSSAFEDGLYELGNKYQHLKGFIREYPIVIKLLLTNTQKIGLVLKNFSTEKYFELEDALNGHTYDFDFEFSIPNVDVSKMSDEEYEHFETELNQMYDELEYAIGKPQFGTLKMYTTDDGIQVCYTLQL